MLYFWLVNDSTEYLLLRDDGIVMQTGSNFVFTYISKTTLNPLLTNLILNGYLNLATMNVLLRGCQEDRLY